MTASGSLSKEEGKRKTTGSDKERRPKRRKRQRRGREKERGVEIKGVLLITVRSGVTGPREASAFLRRLVKCPWYSAAGNIFRLRLSKDPTLTFHLTGVFASPPRLESRPRLNPIRQPCAQRYNQNCNQAILNDLKRGHELTREAISREPRK